MSVSVEGIIATEALRFVRKDRTKLKLALGLYALSASDPSLGKLARASYYFMRHLDDVLDGEREIDRHPLEYVQGIKRQIVNRQSGKYDRITALANFAIPLLEKKGDSNDHPRQEFTQAIDALIFDYHRRIERRSLTNGELSVYYHDVLDPGLNLMLIGFGSGLRAKDMNDFSPNLGRLYSVRDLDKDWTLGFINIPAEVLAQAELDSNSSLTEVKAHPTIGQWKQTEVADSSYNLNSLKHGIDFTHERLARFAIDGIIDSAVKSAAATV